MEEWKDIEGYEGIYQISNKGNIRSCEREIDYLVKGKYKAKRVFLSKILKPYRHTGGYLLIDLHNNGIVDKRSIHRLVAETFIPNTENKPTVNHKNHIRDDNRVENLEWSTYSEQNDDIWKENRKNIIYSDEIRKKMSESQKKRFETEEPWMKGKHHSEEVKEKISDKNSKKIYQYTLDNELVAVYKSQTEASLKNNIRQGHISNCCTGRVKTYKGYKWSFEPL